MYCVVLLPFLQGPRDGGGHLADIVTEAIAAAEPSGEETIDQIAGVFGGFRTVLEIDGDRRVGRGGCVIETNAGSIDAKIDTQLEQVESALRG